MTDLFHFQLKSKEFAAFEAKSTKELFKKWGMVEMSVQLFSYDSYFDVNHKEKFVDSFFKDQYAQHAFKTFSTEQLSHTNASVDLVPTTVKNMSIFDVLYSSGLVRQCGSISKCFDEMIGDILVSDELRKMFLSEESEFYAIFRLEEKNEFIFSIFQHLVVGGYCNQYEDNVKPYIETAKCIYKDLIQVYRDSVSKTLSIASIVLRINLSTDENNKHVFPGRTKHIQNFCYMIVNPEKREVILWHHVWDL